MPIDHPNNDAYDTRYGDVPSDLTPYYREFKPGYWAYVCPACGNIFGPVFGSMPGSFRTHIKEIAEGKGCFFRPKAQPVNKISKKVADF